MSAGGTLPSTKLLKLLQSTLVISTSPISNNCLCQMKIWSLFKHENPITSYKILWKRGEIPKEQFLLFSTIFWIYLKLQESNYIFICEMWLFDSFFPQFCKSDMSSYGYLEVFWRALRLCLSFYLLAAIFCTCRSSNLPPLKEFPMILSVAVRR